MKTKGRIFLDTAAGTPLDEAVVAAMRPLVGRDFGNPSSLHAEGERSRAALAAARQAAADFLSAWPSEIVFTAGGTEANNLALAAGGDGEVITSAIEHPSVLAPAAARRLIIAPVLPTGQLDLVKFAALLNPNTRLVSIMIANNEIGSLQPIAEIGRIIRRHRRRLGTPYPYFHTDACQAARFLPLNVRSLGVDLLTLNAGKIYGPKGVGLLFVRAGVNLPPLALGGGQEEGRRAGTENLPGIAGLAAALQLAARRRDREARRLSALRDWFWLELQKRVPAANLNGSLTNRLPNNLNISFPGVLAEQVVLELDAQGFAVSTGSACAIPKHDDSYVILALGYDRARALSAIRLSFGRETTRRDLTKLLKILPPIINRLTTANHVYAADLVL